jgi:hypothetical protein
MACLPMKEGSHPQFVRKKPFVLGQFLILLLFVFAQIINPYYNYKFRQIDHRMPENIFQKQQLRAT